MVKETVFQNTSCLEMVDMTDMDILILDWYFDH